MSYRNTCDMKLASPSSSANCDDHGDAGSGSSHGGGSGGRPSRSGWSKIRKHKSKSLIVPTTIVSDTSDYGGNSPSPDFLKPRFSFRSFRRGRSLSKTRCSTDQPTDSDLEQAQRSDESDRDTPLSTSPSNTCSSPMRKSTSVVDFKSFCTKLHRHLTAGIDSRN